MIKNIVYIIALSLPSVLEVSAADLSKQDIENIALQVETEDIESLRSANTLLFNAIAINDMQDAGQAILAGAQFNGFSSSDSRFIVPLIAAADAQSHDAVSFLVAMGADIDQQDTLGNTALLQAVKSNDKNMVKLLLDLNADVNVANSYGTTPLICAAREGSADIAQLLIDLKVDLNAQDICGDTALSLALLYNHFEVANILVSAGADVNIANKNGITPLSYAIRYNLEKIKCVMKEKIVEKIENATNIKDRIALEDQLRQL
jgi:ankyrin repeat protein